MSCPIVHFLIAVKLPDKNNSERNRETLEQSKFMAGWSVLTNGSSVLENVETVSDNLGNDYRDCIGNECIPMENEGGDDSDGYKINLRSLFDQVLSIFLEEIAGRGIFRPSSAVFANGQSVDLFKLFQVVKDRGGYDWVSKKGLWDFVAEDLGLGRGFTSALKLIYFKYLSELVKWFEVRREKFGDWSNGNLQFRTDGNFGFLPSELETEFKDFLSDGLDKERDQRTGKYVEVGIAKSETCLSNSIDKCKTCLGFGQSVSDNDEKCSIRDNGDVLVLSSIVEHKEKDLKRKRESLSGMLKWLIETAKDPYDLSIGKIPEPSKWKEHDQKELWVQAIKVRDEVLLRKKMDLKTEDCVLQKKPKMHPSIYEDNSTFHHQPMERLRCSGRLPNLVKPRLCPCCNSCSPSQSTLMSPRNKKLVHDPEVQVVAVDTKVVEVDAKVGPSKEEKSTMDTKIRNSEEEICQNHIFLARADVPQWTDIVSESDSKWLGTTVWPPEGGELRLLVESDSLGQGRPDSCDCSLPGSVECIRFHIAEARMKLKLELGLVFYQWRFDRMGEEVSLKWTNEEEKRFKHLVRANFSSNTKSFWNDASRWFPKKTRENLVSYYFNVLLVQRRSYQNRVSPKSVDSDDDETEFGCLSDGFRNYAIKASGSDFQPCSENKQCTDLE